MNEYAEYIMRNAGLEEAQAGIKISWRNINNLRYADAAAAASAKSLQLCLCIPMDFSPPGSPVCGILQGRILEWVTMPFLICTYVCVCVSIYLYTTSLFIGQWTFI